MFKTLREYFRRKKLEKIRKNTELGDLVGIHYDGMNQYANEIDMVPDLSNHIQANTSIDYSKIERRTRKEYDTRKIHHQKSGREADDGAYVLKFNIAGSGLNQWPKMHKGLTGYNELEHFERDDEKNEQINENDNFIEVARKKSHIKYKMGTNIQFVQNQLKAKVQTEFGTPMYITDNGVVVTELTEENRESARILPGLRLRVKDNSVVEVNTSGPLGLNGMINSGDYSIDNLTNYGKQIVTKWLDSILKDISDNPEKKDRPIKMYLKGHSRGGCAADELSTMINFIVHNDPKYKPLEKNISINLQLYDPVPGPDGMITGHGYVNHSKADAGNKGKMERGLSVDKKNDATVFYSLHSNRGLLFAPRTVLGAKRIVLTGMSHNMRLFDIQENEVHNSETGLTENKKSKRGYISGETGEEYRGTSLHDAKDGLFICDENGVVFEIKNRQEAHNLLDSVYEIKTASSASQKMRHNTMYQVVDNWFDLHKDREIITPKDSRFETINQFKGARASLLRELINHSKGKSNLNTINEKVTKLIGKMVYERELLKKINADKNRMTSKSFNKYNADAINQTKIRSFINGKNFKKFIGSLDYKVIIDLASDIEGKKLDKLLHDYSKVSKTVHMTPFDIKKWANKTEALDYISCSTQLSQGGLYLSGRGIENTSSNNAEGIYALLNKEYLSTLTFAYMLNEKDNMFLSSLTSNFTIEDRKTACDEVIDRINSMTNEEAANWISSTIINAQTKCLDYIDGILKETNQDRKIEMATRESKAISLANHIKNMSEILFMGDFAKAADEQMGSEKRIQLVLDGINANKELNSIYKEVNNNIDGVKLTFARDNQIQNNGRQIL